MTDDTIDWRAHFGDVDEREEAARLVEALRDARKALADHPVKVAVDTLGEVVRCERSGVPILHDDETVEDPETGEIWIRSAIGLPARAILDEDDPDMTEDESAFEDA